MNDSPQSSLPHPHPKPSEGLTWLEGTAPPDRRPSLLPGRLYPLGSGTASLLISNLLPENQDPNF